MSRIAVTGASGFIGRHLVPQLVSAGHEVSALIHDRPPRFGATEVAVTRGDVRSAEALRAVVDGCSALVHLAPGLAQTPDLEDVIVAGTDAVVRAATDAGVERAVVVSCLGAQAASRFPFYAAKWKAEQLVRGSGLPYVILRPSLVLGPGDGFTAPLATHVRSFPLVFMPGQGTHRQQPIDVDDMVRCILLSLERDDILNLEISVGGPMFLTPRQLVDLLSGILGLRKPKVPIPARWLTAAGRAAPGRMGPLSPARIAQLETESTSSPGIVGSIFGFDPQSVVPRLGSYLAADTLS
jgi:NADH dehydrogenase